MISKTEQNIIYYHPFNVNLPFGLLITFAAVPHEVGV